jgi:hypothetical protein
MNNEEVLERSRNLNRLKGISIKPDFMQWQQAGDQPTTAISRRLFAAKFGIYRPIRPSFKTGKIIVTPSSPDLFVSETSISQVLITNLLLHK